MVTISATRFTAIVSALLVFSTACPAAESLGQAQDSKVAQVGVLCPTADPQALELYNGAVQLQSEGRRDEAESLYRKAIDRDGRYCDAMDNLGQLLRTRGELPEAVALYKRSLAIRPDNQAAHLNLAVAYKFQNNLAGAQEEYLWLIRNAPSNVEGFYGLGTLFLNKGEYDPAIENLLIAERMYLADGSPYVGDARYALGVAWFGKKECVQARQYLLQAYPERADDRNTNYMLGVCYLDPATGDKKKAAEYLLKARSLGAVLPPAIARQLEP